MGKIGVEQDPENPLNYIVIMITNEGQRFTFSCNDEGFDDIIDSLRARREIVRRERQARRGGVAEDDNNNTNLSGLVN